MPNTFARISLSANSSYWQGKVVRTYLTSVLWNLRRRLLFVAASRGLHALAGLALAWRYILAPDFFKAVTKAIKVKLSAGKY